MMSKQKQQKSQKAQAPKQAQEAPKQQAKTKGALSAAAAVRLWQGETISRSLLVAEKDGISVFNTEMQLSKKDRRVAVATKRRAEIRDGRVHPLDNPVVLGTGAFAFDQALTPQEAAARAAKWLKRAKALDQLARQGDEEAKERARVLRERAKTLAKAYNLVIEKDGAVAVKSETESK